MVTDANGLVVAAAEKVNKGAVFVFGDEWVTYTSQWQVGGCPGNDYTDPYNPCYQKSAPQVFQTAQFWYDAIYYVSPVKTCQIALTGATPIIY